MEDMGGRRRSCVASRGNNPAASVHCLELARLFSSIVNPCIGHITRFPKSS